MRGGAALGRAAARACASARCLLRCLPLGSEGCLGMLPRVGEGQTKSRCVSNPPPPPGTCLSGGGGGGGEGSRGEAPPPVGMKIKASPLPPHEVR